MSKKPKRQETQRTSLPSQSVQASSVPTSAGSATAWMYADDIEPRADSSAMPVWFFVVLGVLAYWGMLHLDRYAGGFNQKVQGPYRSYRQLADLQPKSGPEMLIAKGEATYAMVCSPCHQPSGLGTPGLNPPLAGSEWVLGTPNRLIRIPLHGLSGEIRVGDNTYNGTMPPFGASPPLDDDENVAAVLSFIRNSWGNKAPPITPEQVKAVRDETASRSSAWTADELLKIPE